MYLHVIVAYFLLFWWPDTPPVKPLVTSAGPSLLIVFGKLPLLWVAATWAATRVRRADASSPAAIERTQHFYHQASLFLSIGTVALFAADVAWTGWLPLVRGVGLFSAIPGLADLVLLIPFFLSLLVLWIASYPVDRSVREAVIRIRRLETPGAPETPVWSLGAYLVFHIRHQLLIAAVPMTVILAAYRFAQQYHDWLARWFRVVWIDHAILGLAALVVFIFAPVMLKYIWSTTPLPDGPVRQRLEAICRRIGLRYRDILVWHSHHMMVNAAVMGLFPRVRYVLLSDALLDSMDIDKIEGVFGHEAGHVRLSHIPYFLLFAVSGMLLVSGFVEILVRVSNPPNPWFRLSDSTIEMAGFAGVLVVWSLGFGWVSRRFERQADLYGVRCLSDRMPRCRRPCTRHSPSAAGPAEGVCASAAAVFSSALDRVAVLNGIPHEERSWRHSSIASRMRFLTALAGDVAQVRAFDRLVRRVKITLWVSSIGGLAFAGWYCSTRPVYRDTFRQLFVQPFTADEGERAPDASYMHRYDGKRI
jgi:STE24 endopeptidase